MGKESECSESVVDGYDDDAFLCEVLTVKFHLGRVSPLESAALDPYEDRKLIVFALCVCPYIEVETVFIAGDVGIDVPFPAVNVGSYTGLILIWNGTELICIVNAIPVLAGLRCFPTVFAYRRLCKRNAFEYGNTGVVSGKAPDKAVLGLYES